MRLGVLGLGSIGRRHVGNLLALGCEVYGRDRSPGAAVIAQAEHPDLILDYTERKLDALVIATPWHTHLDWVEKAIEWQIPFFVEKPLGALEQLPRWRELAAMELPVNQVGYQCRFHLEALGMKRMSNVYGGNVAVWCDMASWPGQSYGPMLLEMSHEIDLALWLGAKPVVQSVHLAHTAAHIHLQGGWYVHLESGSAVYRREWLILGKERHQAVFNSPLDMGTSMYYDEMAHFIDCVKQQRPTACPLVDGIRVLDVCAQAVAMSKKEAVS